MLREVSAVGCRIVATGCGDPGVSAPGAQTDDLGMYRQASAHSNPNQALEGRGRCGSRPFDAMADTGTRILKARNTD
jgi:hypothetical protein